MSSHGRALGASGATSLHDVDLGTGRIDAKADPGSSRSQKTASLSFTVRRSTIRW